MIFKHVIFWVKSLILPTSQS